LFSEGSSRNFLLGAAFEQFLGREFAQENLQFYREVVAFESASHADKKMTKKHAQDVINKFLGGGGEEQKLNLNLRQISQINANLKKKPNQKLFAEAKQDIEQLLRTKYVSFCQVRLLRCLCAFVVKTNTILVSSLLGLNTYLRPVWMYIQASRERF